MSLKLEIERHVEHGRHAYGISSVKYSGKPEFKTTHSGPPVKGRLLPNGQGFSFNMEPPFASFKTIRAMYNCGNGELARKCYSEYHRSWITPDFVWDGILKYGYRTNVRLDDTGYVRALNELRKMISVEEKIPLHAAETCLLRIPQSTSPGLPYLHTHPGKKKGEILETNFSRIERYWMRVRRGEKTIPLYDCAAFARSHISREGNKVRPVWAYPLHAIIGEAPFSYPILDELVAQRIGHNTAYGMEMMKGGMTWLNDQMLRVRRKDPGSKFIMTDYSAFDSTVPAWLIRDVFEIIAEKLDFSRIVTSAGIQQIDPLSYKRQFKKIVNYFINTPIRNSDGRRFQKDHGIPSGSMFTNIIGTFVNFVVSRYVVYATMSARPLMDVYFGDDAFIAVSGKSLVNMNDIARCVAECFGMTINVKKSYWTNQIRNVHFLGYYNCFGTPYKPTLELISSMIFPQYLKDDWSYCLSRALGCLLASAGTNRDVFVIARSIYQHALLRDGAVDDAISMINNNPRMVRHLSNMGYDDIRIGTHFFEEIRHSIPDDNCTKILKGISAIL